MSSKTGELYEFGPFRIYPNQRLLLRDNRPVPLHPKAFETLLVLVRNSERLVLREDLMNTVWPDTFVEEANLTQNIFVLRKTIGEATDGRRYIVTVPGKGYRFAATVRTIIEEDTKEKEIPEGNPDAAPPPIEGKGLGGPRRRLRWKPIAFAAMPVGRLAAGIYRCFDRGRHAAAARLRQALSDSAEAPSFIETVARQENQAFGQISGQGQAAATPPPRNRTVWRWPLLIGAPAIALTAASIYSHFHSSPLITEKDTVVLADFTNTTGDLVFDGTLRQGLAVQLEQSPFLGLVSEAQLQQTLRMMGLPSGARLTPEIAREICQRTTSTVVLYGSIASLGSQYVLGLDAVNCRTGNSLAKEQVTADGKEHVLKALARAASNLRRRLGESLTTMEKFNTPVEQATTPSLEALRAYSFGVRSLWGTADSVVAASFFRRAIELDPNFAMAYALLGLNSVYMGQTDVAAENTRKAYGLREHVSQREKFVIEANYYFLVTGNLERARQAYELWVETYPRDTLPPGSFAATHIALGQYDKALEKSRDALRLKRGSGADYAILVGCFLLLNRLEEARAVAQEAQAKKLDSAWLHTNLYVLAFLENDVDAMARQVEWAAGKPGLEDVLLVLDADTAAYSGRLTKARELSRRAIVSAERIDGKETAAHYEADAALREALFGNFARARAGAATALQLSTGRDVQYGAALALTFSGSVVPGGIDKLLDDFERRFPEDTMVQFNYLPTLRAQLALSRNDSSSAIEVLRAATPYETASNGSGAVSTSLYPVYVRGQAFLAAHRGDQAAAEFQKILDHRGVVYNEPIGALSHLGLARSYAISGDTAKARRKYEDFFVLWKDADVGILVLEQARREYAKLP